MIRPRLLITASCHRRGCRTRPVDRPDNLSVHRRDDHRFKGPRERLVNQSTGVDRIWSLKGAWTLTPAHPVYAEVTIAAIDTPESRSTLSARCQEVPRLGAIAREFVMPVKGGLPGTRCSASGLGESPVRDASSVSIRGSLSTAGSVCVFEAEGVPAGLRIMDVR